MSAQILRVLARVNVAAKLCEAALGPKHPVKYRLFAGLAIMGFGVGFSGLPATFDIHFLIVHKLFELVGSGIHGIGLVPFIEVLLKSVESAAEQAVEEI